LSDLGPTTLRRRYAESPQTGATVVEFALILVVGTAVVLAAVFLGQSWRQSLAALGEASGVPVHVAALSNAVENWYRWEYCHVDPERPDLPLAPQFPIDSGSADLAPYLLPVPRLPDPREGKGEYDWEIVRSAQTYSGTPPPQLRVFWHPPERFDERIPLIARDLEAACDSDGDADTLEPCGSQPRERLFWEKLLAVRAEERAYDDLRVQAWLTRNAIECRAEGVHLRLHTACDGDGNGRLGPGVDQDGDGVDDTWRLDANGDGDLDFDLTADLVVDVSDFRVMGC
jgi:Flp pilus assembly pilin Flp